MKRMTFICSCGPREQLYEDNEPTDSHCLLCGDRIRKMRIQFNYREHLQFNNGPGVDGLMKENPRWSKAMGVNPETVPEAMRRFPDRVYNADGDLLVRNRAHKVRLMRENGVTEV